MSDRAALLYRVCAELAERISRTRRYLQGFGAPIADDYARLINTIAAALDKIEYLIPQNIELLRKAADPDDAYEVAKLEADAQRVSEWFARIHELLAYLPPQPITSDTIDLLGGAFGRFHDELSPSTVLGTIFNAVEYDFGEVVKTHLPNPNDFDVDGQNIVVQLPVCDRLSPASWPILAHEFGHAIEARHDIARKVVAESSKEENPPPYLVHWCRELATDLIAARVLGPSPILATLSLHYCLFFRRDSFRAPTPFHPAMLWRLDAVTQALREWQWEAQSSILVKEREVFLRFLATYDDKPDERRTLLFDPLVRPVAQRVVELALPAPSWTDVSIERCLTRLRSQLPIAAQGEPREELRDAVAAFTAGDRTGQSARFVSLAARFSERPVNVAAIVFAGQAIRLEHLYRVAADSAELSDATALAKWCDKLADLDALVARSIGTSAVHRRLVTRSRASTPA